MNFSSLRNIIKKILLSIIFTMGLCGVFVGSVCADNQYRLLHETYHIDDNVTLVVETYAERRPYNPIWLYNTVVYEQANPTRIFYRNVSAYENEAYVSHRMAKTWVESQFFSDDSDSDAYESESDDEFDDMAVFAA